LVVDKRNYLGRFPLLDDDALPATSESSPGGLPPGALAEPDVQLSRIRLPAQLIRVGAENSRRRSKPRGTTVTTVPHARHRNRLTSMTSVTGFPSGPVGPRTCRSRLPWPWRPSPRPGARLACPQTGHEAGRAASTPGT